MSVLLWRACSSCSPTNNRPRTLDSTGKSANLGIAKELWWVPVVPRTRRGLQREDPQRLKLLLVQLSKYYYTLISQQKQVEIFQLSLLATLAQSATRVPRHANQILSLTQLISRLFRSFWVYGNGKVKPEESGFSHSDWLRCK